MGCCDMGERKDLRGHAMKLKPVAKDLWQEMDGQQGVCDSRDAAEGSAAGDRFPGVQLERVEWYENG